MEAPGATERPTGGRGGLAAAWWVPVLALALVPLLGTLDAPLVSDDAAALGHVHREGALADWTGPQYGMRVVRFWRPVVTTSLWLQERWTGVDPAPLRLANALAHAASAVLVGLLARRLGGGRLGALVAGVLAATFPEHGGVVTWIVGRVDALSVPLVLLAGLLALDRRPLAAGVVAALACATKEVAFVLPAWTLLVAWGRGDALRAAARAAALVLVGCVVAFVVRRLALGTWVGGYPPPPDARPLLAAATFAAELARLLGPWLVAAPLAALALARRPRACGAALLAAATVAGPLVGLLADGAVEPQNRRTLYLADLSVALALGAGLGGGAAALAGPRSRLAAARPVLALGLALAATAAGLRAARAVADAREWAAAGELAEAHVERTRATLEGTAPTRHPVLDATLPATHEGAYCLAWGVADRFRPPFPAAPRPVWPLRPAFGRPESERPRSYLPAQELVWPLDRSRRVAPLLAVRVDGAPLEGPVPLDGRVAREPDASPVLEVWGTAPQGTRLELVAYTELGYEPAAWPAHAAPAREPSPLGGVGEVRRLSLRDALLAGGFVTLGDALLQAADVGATRAYLEVRVVDDARGVAHRPVATSPWIELVWEPDLVDELVP